MKASTVSSARRARRPSGKSSADAILIGAKRLFLAEGYDGVNLERIAEAAGVSRQTVYNQFGSKEAVFRSMIEFHWASINRDDIFSNLHKARVLENPKAILNRFADAIFRFVSDTDQIAFTRLVISESRRLPWIGQEFYRLGKQPLLRAFVVCIEKMIEDRQLSCQNPELAAHQFLGLIQEFIIWPRVMAIGPAILEIPPDKVVIEEAIRMFLGRYRVDRDITPFRP
ncbi:TetR family transcriptional regulator [Bradyrhizobium sp. LTSP885]|uniref:TetR/AcrR family transcriptional regulator n=1 Tax=Bradyrhizobium sp. LTSP885 TaxID=1619232 RepID=UPI0005C9EDC9|nr:TetR/AcrR family transcriptional regulator [Bradyrhizobium sp. LTSP885]KJC50483.1 TetR family transcriptional regulator [Bradyrhizobium sp. LTSP885]